jgi:hypothetical protein
MVRTDIVEMVHVSCDLCGEDLEYSLRLKRLGYSFFWIPASRCIESRGGKVMFSLLGRPGEAYPTAWAFYYAFRNEASIHLRYRGYAGLLRTMLYALKVALYLCAAERARCILKLSAIARGLQDGCFHRLGRNQRYLP